MAYLTSPRHSTKIYIISLALLFIEIFASPAHSNSSIQLTWEASPDPDLMGYHVYMGTSPGSYPTIQDVGLSQSFIFQNLADGQAYYFSVTAYDYMKNESSPSEEATVAIPDSTSPTLPQNVTFASVSNSGIALQWTASTDNVGVIGYEVARDHVVIGQTPTTAFVDGATSPGLTYSYTVQAKDANGNVSGWSNPVQVTTTQSLTQLNVSTSGNGSIISSPNGINCPKQSCTGTYPPGTVVTLTASPGKGWTFDGWSGSCTGTDLCRIALTNNMAVNANFSKGSTSGSGKGSGGSGGKGRNK